MDDQKESTDVTKTDTESHLNSFVAELIQIQDDKLVSKSDLEKLLDKHQLSQEDISKLQMLIDRHLSRAAEYTNRERWDNAIVETERALLFSPLDNEIRLDLAELFLKRSTKYGYLQKDLNRADHEVQDALILEPENTEAKKFQKELKDLKKILQGSQNNKMFIPLLLAVFLILGIALFPQLRKRFQFLSMKNSEMQTSSESSIPQWETRTVDIIASNGISENFDITFADTTLIRESQSGTPALSLSGYVEALKDDYKQLELELMPDSESSSGITLPLISTDDAPLRRGETESFSKFIYLKESPEIYNSLYLTVKKSQKFFEKEAVNWKDIDYYRKKPLPQGVFISLQSLHQNQLEGYDRNYMFYDIRLTNKSIVDLKAVDVLCTWLDRDGKMISSKPLSFVKSEALPVKSQSIQTYRVMFDLPKKAGIDNGTLSVTLENAEKE